MAKPAPGLNTGVNSGARPSESAATQLSANSRQTLPTGTTAANAASDLTGIRGVKFTGLQASATVVDLAQRTLVTSGAVLGPGGVVGGAGVARLSPLARSDRYLVGQVATSMPRPSVLPAAEPGGRSRSSMGLIGLMTDTRVPRESRADLISANLADLEARLDSVLHRFRVSFEEWRALYLDSDALLKTIVSEAVANGDVRAADVGPQSEWGLVPFEQYVTRTIGAEVSAKGYANQWDAVALARVGANMPAGMLGQQAPPLGQQAAEEERPWWHWKELLGKLLSALGLDDFVDIVDAIWDALRGTGPIVALGAALDKLKKAATDEAKDAAKKEVKEAAGGVAKAILNYLKEKGGKIGEAVGKLLAKIGIPGWLASIILVFVILVLANIIKDWLFG